MDIDYSLWVTWTFGYHGFSRISIGNEEWSHICTKEDHGPWTIPKSVHK